MPQEEGWKFRVGVQEEDSKTEHTVTMQKEFYALMSDDSGASPEDIVEQSFEFLLEREPKESILRQFDIAVIGTYFPEYAAELKKKLKVVAR